MVKQINILGTSRSGHNWVGSMIQDWLDLPEMRVNEVEGPCVQYLTNVDPKHLEQYNLDGVTIVVLRDFPNFLASSFMTLDINSKTWENNIRGKIEKYEKIVDYALNNLSIPIISYQFFKSSPSYRKRICKSLGGEYKETKLNILPNEGGGSSFDKFKYQNMGSKMSTNKRYMKIMETEWEDIYCDFMRQCRGIMDKWVKLKNDNRWSWV